MRERNHHGNELMDRRQSRLVMAVGLALILVVIGIVTLWPR